MKTAIVYDRVNKFGGAERVLLALHELFPDAPLYTSVYSPEKAGWADVFPKVIPSFLQKIPVLKDHHQLFGWLTPIAYESFSFDGYDLVISVTSEAAKGILTKPQTRHICYCLTPTRYLWSGYDLYLKDRPSDLGWIPFYKYLSKPFLAYTKHWDKIAAQRPDVMVAISTEVKDRIKRYYGRESKVIYPPVDTDRFQTQSTVHQPPFTDFYLIVSRLEPYKKVDLAIEAFIKMGKTLVVAGTGSMEFKYKSKYLTERGPAPQGKYMKNKNIIFTGFIEDDEVVSLMQNAKGFIYPQEEDFGITAVEAQAAGCPVIAYKKGGAIDTVVAPSASSGRVATGVFFDEQNVESLIASVQRFEKMKFVKKVLQKNAERFDTDRFKKEILDLVKKNG